MDLIKKIIEFILELLGLKQKEPPQLTAADKDQLKQQALGGTEDLEGEENVKVHGTGEGSRVIREADGALLIEDDGEQLWSHRIDTGVPRGQWKDVWGPLAKVPEGERLLEFVVHSRQFDMLHSGQPLEAEKKLLELGYKSVGEYFRVQYTVYKYHASPTGPNVGDCVVDSQEYMSAVMKADSIIREREMAARVASNPELLAPVDGVTVEIYAALCARAAQGMSQADMMKLLASYKLDFATWEKANKVWTDRMSKDTTATIATIYGKAFMQQGQGQFGAAAQSHAATGWDGTAAGGKEPLPFDKVCEIQGAMSAWSKSGQDVNALLKKHFNMVAADWSAASTWWLSQLTADLRRFDEYNKKCEAYEKKWADKGGASDADIQF